MSRVTDIKHHQGNNKDRVYIYIDNQWCCSVRERTFPSLKVEVGTQIDCQTLKARENFAFKNAYAGSWEKEKERLEYVEKWLSKYIKYELEIIQSGFGASSTEYIEEHPEEKGEPDLTVKVSGLNDPILFLEVSGTDFMRGTDYWLRKDKVEYIQNHPEKDIWVALVYLKDKKIIWLKIDSKKYQVMEKIINGITEYYVVFEDGDFEIKSSSEFKSYIEQKFEKNIL